MIGPAAPADSAEHPVVTHCVSHGRSQAIRLSIPLFCFSRKAVMWDFVEKFADIIGIRQR